MPQALLYRSFGDPKEVLSLEEISNAPLTSRSIRIKFLAAPINPADFGRINGTYGNLPELPAVAGMEGIAEVVETGVDVSNFSIGDQVLPIEGTGTWQETAIIPAPQAIKISPELPIEQAAMLKVNPPTAWRLLHDFAKLEPGNWIIQNAATSGVGQLVIQFAKHLGIRTVNLVRSLDRKEELESLGADTVILDNKDASKAILNATGGRIAKLGLNSVGASSTYSITKCLADHSPLVTFGGMDRALAPFPTRYLIFNDIQMRGFWVNKWYRDNPRSVVESMLEEIQSIMIEKEISTSVSETYPLSEYEAAMNAAQAPGKPGKVLFKM